MNDVFLGLIGSANLASLGLIVKIYFMVGEITATQRGHDGRLIKLEKKNA